MAKAPRSALLLLVASLAFLRWTAPSFAGTRSPKVALHSALQQKLEAFGRQKPGADFGKTFLEQLRLRVSTRRFMGRYRWGYK